MRDIIRKWAAFAAVLLLLVAPMAGYAYSATTTRQASPLSAAFCQEVLSPLTPLHTNLTLTNQLITISIIIIGIMVVVVGIAFALGYAFDINRLKQFSKIEIGEILVTLLIIIVFLSTSSILNRFSNTGNTFGSACESLSAYSVDLIPSIFELATAGMVLSLVQRAKLSFTFGIASSPLLPAGAGASGSFSISPFSGLSVIERALSLSMKFITLMLMLLLGIVLLLSVIHSVFPLFLFVGIVLRTIPWTRPAGGAFLGLFIGFFVFFPMVLSMMLPAIGPATTSICTSTGVGGLCQAPALNNAPTQSISAMASILNGILDLPSAATYGIIGLMIDSIMGPAIFAVVAVIITLLLTMDFAETVGDLLGAPTLSSKGALGRLI